VDKILEINPGLVVWTIVAFLILLALLKKMAWGPILEGLERREKAIADAVNAAEEAKRGAAGLLDENRKLLAKAEADAEAIRSKATSEAEGRAAAIFQEAQARADAQVERAKREIALEEARAIAAVRKEAVNLAIEGTRRLIKKNVDTADNRRLVEDFVAGLETKEMPRKGTG
jgi:F-type H+-transporting ATPase subunit b